MTRRSLFTIALLFPIAVANLVGCTGTSDTSTQQQQVWFAEESAARGVLFRHESGHRKQPLLPEITGSGAALVDVNGDGFLDIYLVQSGSLYEDADEQPNALFLNRGDGTFQRSPNNGGAGGTGYGMGVAAGDYNNDGAVDLYVTNVGPNVLYQNDGSGNFRDVTAAAGVEDSRWGSSAAFVDLDSDGDLDLYLANYINWSHDIELDCYLSAMLVYCPPTNYQAPTMDRLFRNNGDGTFTDVSLDAGLDKAFGNGFGVVTADYDGDGRQDIFVANDMMVNQLWVNQGELRFVDAAMNMSVAVDEYGEIKAGMGVASVDLDEDGDFDVIVCNLRGQTDSVFRNDRGYFTDITSNVGLSAASRRYTRWGVTVADFDNNGHLELYEVNGAVAPRKRLAHDIYAEPNTLYEYLPNGRFKEVDRVGGTESPLIHNSRGLAVGDIDNDGGLDLVVMNRDSEPYLLVNRHSDRGNWILFRLLELHKRDAHGATLTATVGTRQLYRSVQPEGSFLSSNDPRIHLGIGGENSIRDVRVRWPTGEVEGFGDFDANQIRVLSQGAGRPINWPSVTKVVGTGSATTAHTE